MCDWNQKCFCFVYKNLKSSFLHDSHIWLWGFYTLVVALAHGAPCGATARCAALCALKPIWNGKPLEIEWVYSKLIGTNLVPLPDHGGLDFLGQTEPFVVMLVWSSTIQTSVSTGRDLSRCPFVPKQGQELSKSCTALSHIPSQIVTGCAGLSHPLVRFWTCLVVPLSQDNEGTSVPLSWKVAVALSCWKH